MAHIALYRKYRPQKFSDVIGQDVVVTQLGDQIKNKTIAHAYLFSGGRGTGKTSVARIFAREIGCHDEDIYEIDAASNRSIDDVRAIRDVIHVSPFSSPYKIYIVDEAHMLTKEAWNALLKTLEEPPAHVIFILATTEKHKVPDTIISRCQVFDFRKPSRAELVQTIEKVVKAEKYSLPKAGAEHVALLGDGSYRDTLGILEKVIQASGDSKITLDEILDVTGAPQSDVVLNVIKYIGLKKADDAIGEVQKASSKGVDIKVFMELFLLRLRLVLLLRYAPKTGNILKESVPEEEQKILEEMAKDKDLQFTSEALLVFLDASKQLSFATVPELPIELAIIKLCEQD